MVFETHRDGAGTRGLRSIGVLRTTPDGTVEVVPAWRRDGAAVAAGDRLAALLAERGVPS